MYTHTKSADIDLSRSYNDVQQIVQCFLSIDIDTDINESSISKKYKWITNLELISADQFKQKKFIKDRNPKQQQMVKHFQIDKLLYLVVTFCEQGKFPIARIRTRKQFQDSQWKTVPYPKDFQGYYEHNISYQYTQSKQCKRIITDIEVCHGKQLQNMGKTQDQWQIATIPQINYSQTKIQRPTLSQSQQSQQRKSNPFNFPTLDSKFSEPSQVRQNNSNLSQTSYYSCNDNQNHSKSSIQKDAFSDLDDRSPSHHSNEKQSKKSSLSEFHSIQQTTGPFYFLMKTIDLYDYHNQFQYTYEPKIININKVFHNSTIEEKYLRSLTKFCFPNGIKLYKKLSGCGFQTFTLILTTEQGQRYFAYCLKYKQKMTHSVENHLLKELYELNLINKDQIYKNQTIYNEKAFCLVSKIQNTDVFHKILQNLYRALLSFASPKKGIQYFQNQNQDKKQRDLQYFAVNLTSHLRNFSKILLKKQRKISIDPLKYIPSISQKSQILQFKWCGVTTYFPKKQLQNKVSMKAMYCLFKLLSVDNILKIMQAALLEKKIFIVSSIQTSILLVLQALIGLLHPLRLSQPIIPIISTELLDLIEAPIPIVAGISEQFVNENNLTKAVYAFLDCNKILLLQQLPGFPISFCKLGKSLKKIQFFNPQHVIQFMNFKDQAYSLGIHQIQEYSQQTHEQLKNLFKNNILSIIKNYTSHYSKIAEQILKQQTNGLNRKSQPVKQVQSQRLSKVSAMSDKSRRHLTFKQMYNSGHFIKQHEKKEQTFYVQFCKSSIFKNLIQQKYLNPDNLEIKIIDKGLQHLDEQTINHFSCFSIPTYSLKKQVSDIGVDDRSSYKESTVVKAKTKHYERQIEERGSLTTIKEQQMKKNLSSKQQQKNVRKISSQLRKPANVPHIPQAKDNKKQKAKIVQNEFMYSQRLSEGATYCKQRQVKMKESKQSLQHEPQPQQRSVGFKICSMVNNVTKKFTQSKSNIINIFSEAKVNRLKKAFYEQNKDKIVVQTKIKCQVQESQNNIFHQTSPQIKIKNKINEETNHQIINNKKKQTKK